MIWITRMFNVDPGHSVAFLSFTSVGYLLPLFGIFLLLLGWRRAWLLCVLIMFAYFSYLSYMVFYYVGQQHYYFLVVFGAFAFSSAAVPGWVYVLWVRKKSARRRKGAVS
ncbi:hypothetical protein C1Y63_01420 [Corynebacterium sp. 13CS0277]|nr:hypothetical protein C1Y63_01420 [Corynebacterium sp. 13CS0277]